MAVPPLMMPAQFTLLGSPPNLNPTLNLNLLHRASDEIKIRIKIKIKKP